MAAAKSQRRKKPKIQRRAPQQRRAQATYDAALEAAARIVRRDGLAGLNTNRIAERAGISVGTLYGYFPDKTAILVALARRLLAEDQIAMTAALASDPGDRVRLIVRTLVARHRTDRELRRAVMSVHLGQGHGDEHSEGVEQFIASLGSKHGLSQIGALRLFVATRAALGVARALVEEHKAAQFSDAEIEDEIVALVEAYLSRAAGPSPASRGAARTSS
ncbi:transcriptional regulator, TetR family [Enhydrobacter aerosaccus]|uniref:Transcriptional regulator, TetR family n=1 Tax=Enhydrobacter aerosaccus TaxID=225324 RepID=A0A1T4THT3_9HYPH|nr:TetR/AcrR family transcriptional regulator [Enhydrobacter aerosaccus]SKA40022.1 transcriptional regulator, TetR family [Enhydrobacter aerosaccus]